MVKRHSNSNGWSFPCTVLALFMLCAACSNQKTPTPEGWYLGGKPLASRQNEILAAGATLNLPEKFTVEAITDCIVRVTQQANGETLVHLLTGTAAVQRNNPQFAIALLANDTIVHLNGTRLLLHSQVGTTRIFLIDGQALLSHQQQRWELSSKSDNLFEMKNGNPILKKISFSEIEKVFPEIVRVRPLMAIR